MSLLHTAPAAGFDEPFALMAACHERMARIPDPARTHRRAWRRTAATSRRETRRRTCRATSRSPRRCITRTRSCTSCLDCASWATTSSPIDCWPTIEMEARLGRDRAGFLEAIRDGSMPTETLDAARERWQTFATLYRRQVSTPKTTTRIRRRKRQHRHRAACDGRGNGRAATRLNPSPTHRRDGDSSNKWSCTKDDETESSSMSAPRFTICCFPLRSGSRDDGDGRAAGEESASASPGNDSI